ncbi:MAG: NADH-quinone oxidoreductase subunit D [Acidobacteria bacterium]|nr:NADH-quinone oxidoreductase subunit D [Acidobacteriota bacterium]MBI3658316.1 NADH-quinone oxidoreductase subunit D [Acidobacteriota bacterium]
MIVEKAIKTQPMVIQLGPSHPAMHGTIKIVVELDGEVVTRADVEIGYLHRAFEKHCEEGTYFQAIPYTDRLNYVSPMICNFGYGMGVEKLLGIQVTERCEFIRLIMSEISRVSDHLTSVGASAMELGAMTAFLYMIKAREFFWELIEAACGARVTVAFVRIGGVKADLPEGFGEKARRAISEVRQTLKEVDGLLTKNPIFTDRMQGVGAITTADAVSYGFTGPLLRACGVNYDVRKYQPYHVYDRLNFDVPTGSNGDNYDRYLVRMQEIEQSLRLIEQALAKIPPGPINVDLEGRVMAASEMTDRGKLGDTQGLTDYRAFLSPNLQGMEKSRYQLNNTTDKNVALPPKESVYTSIEGLMNHFKLVMLGHGIRPPQGEVYSAVEGANGEFGFYMVSDGSDRPYRVHVRAPCFPLMAALHRMIEGGMVADIVPTFGSINMIGGELDR